MITLIVNKAIKHKRVIKYLIAGGLAAAVDLALLYILTDIFQIWYLFSASLAFIVAFFVSFFLQKFWTFRDGNKEIMYRQMKIYLAVALANLALNAALMWTLVEAAGLWYMLAQFIASGLIALESYLIYKAFIFNQEVAPNGDKLKILIATGIYPPDIGGPATYAVFLKQELLKLGCDIKIMAYGLPTDTDAAENIYRIALDHNILTRYLKFFIQAYHLAGWADVFYTLDLMSAGLPAVVAAAMKRKKVIFRTGGDWLWEKAYQSGWTDLSLAEYYHGEKAWPEKLLMLFCRLLLRRIRLVIFSTEFQAKIYQDHYGLPSAKIKFIANARPRLNAALPDSQYQDAIIFAGRLIKLKNLSRLIKVFGKIKSERLVIFGQGPAKADLEDLINQLGLQARVEINDSVPHSQLISFIGCCKFFILPSITEISPNLALECLSLAKPIILTKETGLPQELMSKLITFNPLSEEDLKNKIEYLLQSDNLANYAESLKQINLEPRDWRQVAEEHLEIFKNMGRGG